MAKLEDRDGRKSPLARLARKSFRWMHVFYIVQASLYVVWIGFAAIVAAAVDYYREVRFLDLFNSKLFFIYSAIFFFTSSTISLIVLYRFVRDKKATLERYVRMQSTADKNELIEPLFLKVAYDNAMCDTKLFDSLFLELQALIPDRSNAHMQSRLEAARAAVHGNIRDIANSAREIFSVQTGAKCAVAVKLGAVDAASPGSSKINAFLRDSDSASVRGRADDTTYRVEQNTAFRSICLDGEPVYLCDDLVAAKRLSNYENPRKGWERDYTATIVTPIYEITSSNLKSDSQQLLGFLCIDNHGGGFEQSDTIRHARELGWRLSVMLYRYRALEALTLVNRTDKESAGKDSRKNAKRSSE